MSFLRNTFRALSRTEKRVFWGALALVVIGAGGLLVFLIKNHTVVVPAHSGTYAEGMIGQPSYVNPVLASTDEDQGLVRLVFATVRDLATSIDTSADGRTVQVHLKQGLAWSDGQPLTSDDVIFTLQSIQNPDSRSSLAGLFQGVTANRVSALEVDFQVENTALAAAIPELRPAPKHLYGDIPLANWRLSSYNLRPVASGPYAFSGSEAGAGGFISTYHLAVNPLYAGTAPYLQKVNFIFFHNTDDLLTAFNSAQVQGFGTADPSLLGGIKRPYALTRFTTPTVYAVFWNQTTNPALGPLEVRWALDLAVDRQKVLAKLGGYAKADTGPFPAAIFSPASGTAPATATTTAATATSSAASTAANDPAKILEQKGWQKGGDGIWSKKIAKATVRLEFTLTVPDIGFLKDAAEELAAEWQAFGADVHLKVLPADANLTTAITNRSYDGLLFGNTVRGTGDLYPFWHSSERFAPGLNLAIYKNAKVDALLQNLRKESDAAQRQKDMQAVSDLIVNDEPAVFLFSLDSLYVSSKNVEGVSAGFLDNPADRLEQLPQWYVDTARKLK